MAAAVVVPGRPSTIDIFETIKKHQASEEAEPTGVDSTVIFVGSKGSGKSSLISRFIHPEKEPATKPTIGMEYTYCRRATQNFAKDVAHIWEIGGGASLAGLLDVALTPASVEHALVVVCLDLSRPHACLDDVLFWIEKVKARVEVCFKELRARGSKLPEKLRARRKNQFGATHVDVERGLVNCVAIPLIIAANQYDLMRDSETELRKMMGRTLRHMAHINGASLVYTDKKDKTLLTNYRTVLHCCAFRQAPLKTVVVDHLKPLCVPAGSDTIQAIGLPPKAEMSKASNPIEMWRNAFAAYFPNKDAPADDAEELSIAKFSESAVDSMRKQKDEELERYRIESTKKLAEYEKTLRARERPREKEKPKEKDDAK